MVKSYIFESKNLQHNRTTDACLTIVTDSKKYFAYIEIYNTNCRVFGDFYCDFTNEIKIICKDVIFVFPNEDMLVTIVNTWFRDRETYDDNYSIFEAWRELTKEIDIRRNYELSNKDLSFLCNFKFYDFEKFKSKLF